MVVGVAHGPAAQVALGLLVVAAVDEAHIAVGPLAEAVEVRRLLEGRGEWMKPKPDTLCFSFFPKHIRIKTGYFSFQKCPKTHKLCHRKVSHVFCLCLRL